MSGSILVANFGADRRHGTAMKLREQRQHRIRYFASLPAECATGSGRSGRVQGKPGHSPRQGGRITDVWTSRASRAMIFASGEAAIEGRFPLTYPKMPAD